MNLLCRTLSILMFGLLESFQISPKLCYSTLFPDLSDFLLWLKRKWSWIHLPIHHTSTIHSSADLLLKCLNSCQLHIWIRVCSLFALKWVGIYCLICISNEDRCNLSKLTCMSARYVMFIGNSMMDMTSQLQWSNLNNWIMNKYIV